MLPRLVSSASCLLAVSTLPAQFVNRATWLGLQGEGVRRDFRQGGEYHLDRFSYVVPPPWWQRGLPRFGDRAAWALGSTSTSQFTIEGALDVRRDLGGGFGFGYHVLQSENRDTRFLRSAIELEYGTGAPQAVFVQSELFAEKGAIDASVGAWLFRRGDEALRVMATAVDAAAGKDAAVEHERAPWALMASGGFGDPDRRRFAFEIGWQLPFEVRDVGRGERLAMSRCIASADVHQRLGVRDWLVGAVELEWTDKALRPDAGPGPGTEDFARDFRQLRLEWWRDDTTPWSLGVLHTGQREDGLRPFAPADDFRTRREEWFGVVRARLPVDGRLSFEPQVLAGHVDYRVQDPGDRRRSRFEGKVSWNTRWDFSPRAALVVVVSAQLDEAAFGGGGADFVVRV
jgi:hypothetical protein